MKSIGHIKPINMIIMVNVIGYGLLFFYKRPYDYYILLAGLSATLLISIGYLVIRKAKMGDEYFFVIICMLSSIGIIMIYRLDKILGFKQIIWFGIGIGLFFISYFLYRCAHIWERATYYYPIMSVLLFISTILWGKSINGARNWIVVGELSFQPSECIKVLFVFFIAAFLNEYGKFLTSHINFHFKKLKVRAIHVLMVITYLHLGFMIIQQEWGTALLMFLVYLTLAYIFVDNIVFIGINAILAAGGGLWGIIFIKHVKVRIDAWLDPWGDIAGKGYQITQSLFAIGSGGFFGTGLGLGTPDFIPEVSTDFIFSAICEEMGIFGGVAIVLLYFILVYRGFKVVFSGIEGFTKILALGITLIFGFQTFIIIGGVIKLIPLTGITLPFISYGGSSLIISFITLGILQAISSRSFKREEEINGEAK